MGLGDVGPEAAIPVKEGKSVLFEVLVGTNVYPLCIDTKNKEEIIKLVKSIQPIFGAINIEDIESPKVLEIVETTERTFNTGLS
jgi:malate dehydrogenase (oxaloacetate-decarboxylating)